MFSYAFGRAASSAAFRMAKAQNLIEVAYISAAGTPVYRGAGIGAAISEASSSVKN
jgi:hypothetical protein